MTLNEHFWLTKPLFETILGVEGVGWGGGGWGGGGGGGTPQYKVFGRETNNQTSGFQSSYFTKPLQRFN